MARNDNSAAGGGDKSQDVRDRHYLEDGVDVEGNLPVDDTEVTDTPDPESE